VTRNCSQSPNSTGYGSVHGGVYRNLPRVKEFIDGASESLRADREEPGCPQRAAMSPSLAAKRAADSIILPRGFQIVSKALRKNPSSSDTTISDQVR
jgi:hypothetical protein